MFPNQQYNESRSIWDPRDTMQISSDMRSSSVPNPQLMLHYPSNNRETQQYRQPWTVEVPQKKEIKSPDQNEFGPNKKCILMTGGIGLLIGLIVCGIPLAVLTTLYLQSKASASTNTGGSSGSGTSSLTLPTQCSSYITNTDSTRNAAYPSTCCSCDSSLTAGWYRFSSGAGTRLATSPVSINSCGASYTGWFNGTLPTTVGATVSGTVCVNYAGYICHTSYSINSVLVTNCDGYYLFFLTPMTICNARYCTV